MANPIDTQDEGGRDAQRASIIDPQTGKALRPEDQVTLKDLKKGIDLDDDEEEK